MTVFPFTLLLFWFILILQTNVCPITFYSYFNFPSKKLSRDFVTFKSNFSSLLFTSESMSCEFVLDSSAIRFQLSINKLGFGFFLKKCCLIVIFKNCCYCTVFVSTEMLTVDEFWEQFTMILVKFITICLNFLLSAFSFLFYLMSSLSLHFYKLA